MGVSTQILKNCGCLSTHSTHTNGGLEFNVGQVGLFYQKFAFLVILGYFRCFYQSLQRKI